MRRGNGMHRYLVLKQAGGYRTVWTGEGRICLERPGPDPRALWTTLIRMNWTFGKGDIVFVCHHDPFVIRRFPHAGRDTRRYRLSADRRKVTFLGRTRVIRGE